MENPPVGVSGSQSREGGGESQAKGNDRLIPLPLQRVVASAASPLGPAGSDLLRVPSLRVGVRAVARVGREEHAESQGDLQQPPWPHDAERPRPAACRRAQGARSAPRRCPAVLLPCCPAVCASWAGLLSLQAAPASCKRHRSRGRRRSDAGMLSPRSPLRVPRAAACSWRSYLASADRRVPSRPQSPGHPSAPGPAAEPSAQNPDPRGPWPRAMRRTAFGGTDCARRAQSAQPEPVPCAPAQPARPAAELSARPTPGPDPGPGPGPGPRTHWGGGAATPAPAASALHCAPRSPGRRLARHRRLPGSAPPPAPPLQVSSARRLLAREILF